MTTNAIEIVRDLRSAGMEPKIAEAVAEAVVKHSDEHLATKADLALVKSELKGDIKSLSMVVKLILALVVGLYVGFAVIFIGSLAG